jgi:hypothetical protein
MTEPKQSHVYVEEIHTEPRSKNITAFRFAIHYDNARAEIGILPAQPLSDQEGLPEIVRLELHSLISALELAAESTSKILLQRAPPR